MLLLIHFLTTYLIGGVATLCLFEYFGLIATPQRLSRFLGGMANLGLIKAVKPAGGSNRWSVLPQGAALL